VRAGSHSLPPVHGLVLAGGHSIRMGQDKAALIWRGQTLLERAVRVLQSAVAEVAVAVRADQVSDPLRRRFTLVVDAVPDMGPAAALLGAHRLAPHAAWLVLACDLARIEAPHLAALLAQRRPEQGATAYRDPDRGVAEPLCALYEPVTLTRLAQARLIQAAAGPANRETLSPRWLLSTGCHLLDPPDAGILVSLNSPADFHAYSGSDASAPD
jgi:molybdenum cofactor guanylyltransferase